MEIEIDGPIQIIKVAGMGPYDNNGYIIADPSTKEAYIIDAPAQINLLIEAASDYKLKAALITHSHPDHIAGYNELKETTNIPVGIHPNDADRLPMQPEFFLEHGMKLKIGSLQFNVLHTPGHTPGGLCFTSDHFIISGDTLFPGGPGMTRSVENFREIVHSITNQLFKLPDNAVVFPGHGINTDIGKARAEYEVFKNTPHPEGLFGTIRWDQS